MANGSILQLASLPSRGVIAIAGTEAREFLQGLITNDMDKLSQSHPLYAALLTPQGKILFDFFLVETGGTILVDCHKAFLPALLKRLKMYRLRALVDLEDVSEGWDVVAAFGSDTAMPANEGSVVFADPRLAALGQRTLVPVGTSLSDEATVASEGDYNRWRLGLGVPDVPHDAEQDKMFLLEANFDELHGVDFQKGCYVGQELASRMKRRNGLRKRLLPVDFDGPVPAPGTALKAGTREIGSLRTSAGSRAMAYIRVDRLKEAEGETLSADGLSFTVDWPSWIDQAG